jgi:VWFA-related protein
VSGGAAFFPHEETNLREICRRIAEEIRNQYTIAFKPNGMGSQGEFHKIRVRIQGERGKDMTVRTREGYYEPSGP